MGKRAAGEGPEPPKRPQSGYGQFVNEKRGEITATLLKEGVDKAKVMTLVSKRAGELWKALGEAEKKPFNQKAESLMSAYTKDMQTFKEANPDFKKVKKLKRGDPLKPPSRPPGAYAQWLADHRTMLIEKVMKEHNVDKSQAFLMLYKECRSAYDALSAQEKKECEEKAEAAKVKFQAEYQEWKVRNKENAGNEARKLKTGDPARPPSRPLGAYAMWISENRPMLTEKVMKEHSVDRSKAITMLHKEGKSVYVSLADIEKKRYEEKAEAAKVKYQAEHKEWKLRSKTAKVEEAEEEDDEEAEEDEWEDQDEEDTGP